MVAQRSGWKLQDYLVYLLKRIRFWYGTGLYGGMETILIGAGVLLWMRYQKHLVRHYVTQALPRFHLPPGTQIIRTVKPNEVVIYTYSHNHSAFLGIYPRGLGLAHIGISRSIGQQVIHYGYPWAGIAIIMIGFYVSIKA